MGFSRTHCWTPKIQDGEDPPYWKSIFGHNSASDCTISVKFCVRKQFPPTNFGNGTEIRVPQNLFFVFLMHFGIRWAAAFVSSPIQLLLEKRAKPCRTLLKSGTAAACHAARTDGVVHEQNWTSNSIICWWNHAVCEVCTLWVFFFILLFANSHVEVTALVVMIWVNPLVSKGNVVLQQIIRSWYIGR